MAESELERWRRLGEGYGRECADAIDVLAGALGYAVGEEGGPQPGDYAIGDHTVVTLAMEAASRLAELQEAEARADRALAYVERARKRVRAYERTMRSHGARLDADNADLMEKASYLQREIDRLRAARLREDADRWLSEAPQCCGGEHTFLAPCELAAPKL